IPFRVADLNSSDSKRAKLNAASASVSSTLNLLPTRYSTATNIKSTHPETANMIIIVLSVGWIVWLAYRELALNVRNSISGILILNKRLPSSLCFRRLRIYRLRLSLQCVNEDIEHNLALTLKNVFRGRAFC